MMVTFSSDAQGHLDRYLQQIKAALRAHPSVDAREVERDVLGHIDAELADEPQPVSASSLHAVLERLGAPDAWVPATHSAPHSAVHQGLSYAALGATPVLLAVGVILFLGGPLFWPLEPVLVIASFLLARVSLELLADRDEPVGAWRWLVYPPLLLIYAVLAIALLSWPMAFVVVASEKWSSPLLSGPLRIAATAAAAVGGWWIVIGFLMARFPDGVRGALRPFADAFESRHARRLVLGGAVLVTLAAAATAVTIAGGSTPAAASTQDAPARAAAPLEPVGAIVDALHRADGDARGRGTREGVLRGRYSALSAFTGSTDVARSAGM